LLVALDDEYLKSETGLGGTERAALASHRKATVRKYDYRRLLDRKKSHGWWAALALVPTMPASVPYIAAETVRAKTSWLFEHQGDDVSLGFRFLLGIPEVQLQLSAGE
jgi:succinoglycan biosynthesis protein ExoU